MLKEYAQKRRFDVTDEPQPSVKRGQGALSFVVQKHAASQLHYDFRLELDGVLVSWAVPKGPSLNHSDKRLAIKVEDHPLEYDGFEGTIPQGEYGGGEVIVWDRGTYHTEKANNGRTAQQKELRRQLDRGKLEFTLEGEKLRGGWVLLHTRDNQWLLMKRADEFATETDVLADDRSVLTGHRIGGVPDPQHSVVMASNRLPPLLPMLLVEAKAPFSDPNWSFELKLDGIRALTYFENGQIRMLTRNGNDVASRFPKLVQQLKELNLNGTVLDGEIVRFDPNGLPNFQALVQPFQAGHVEHADYCVFDLVYSGGEDLRKLPWKDRRKRLEDLKISGGEIRLLDVFPEDGQTLFERATSMGFEGVVGKRIDSKYEAGVRSPNWVKLKKHRSEEFSVGGYTKGEGARKATFGALVLGRVTERGLEYVGKCGGGFDDAGLDQIGEKLSRLKSETSPFSEEIPVRPVQYVRPEMKVEVRFTGWTKDGRLRFPIFLRERPDLALEMLGGAKMAFKGVKGELQTTVEGHELRFTHLDTEIWPGVTKGDLTQYYADVSETLLKYLKNRPLSLVRLPNGITGERFFQKHIDRGRPDFVETVSIYSDSNEGARDFIMCNNLATLLWLGQMATVELNPWNSRIDPEKGSAKSATEFAESHEALENSILNRPDYLVLDLDPHFGGKASGWKHETWMMLVEVAYALRDLLGDAGLKSFPKSSGKSGLHLYVPVARQYTYEEARSAVEAIGEKAAAKLGSKVTLEWNVKKRPDGVFIDVNQNVRGKTMAAPYSPRAANIPAVSMPLLWDELERVNPTQFTFTAAIERLAQKGDLWSETLGLNQRLGD